MKINRVLLLLIVMFGAFTSSAYALEYSSGDIRNPVVTAESDGIIIKKKVSATDSDLEYNVEFTIEGKNIINTLLKKVYVSVIFDKSGSMLCDNGTSKERTLIYNQKAVINGQDLYCRPSNILKLDKWNSAVAGAVAFSKDLIEKIETSNINLFTFSDSVTEELDWNNKAFSTDNFGYPNGSTMLHLAVRSAKNKLSEVEDDALKYILIISDGRPQNIDKLKQEIEQVKSSGIKIYAIGYDANDNAKAVLKDASSGEGFYYDATVEGISTILKNLATKIEEVAFGKNAVMIDTIGDNFSYKNGDDVEVKGNVVSYSFDKITDDKITFDFNILLNDNLSTGWYETNNVKGKGVRFTYEGIDGENKEIFFDESPEVYYEKEKIPYVINYYKDSVSFNNFLGNVEGSGEFDELIGIDKNKYLLKGYNSDNVLVNSFKIKENNNVINIVYEKQLYNYHIEYYNDEISIVNLRAKTKDISHEYLTVITDKIINEDFGSDWINNYKPLGYKDGLIIGENIKIDVDNNVIKVLYLKRDDLFYKVEYYFDGNIDNSKTKIVTNKELGEKIDNIKFESYDNYIISEVDNYPFSITGSDSDNVIKVYYKSKEEDILPPKTSVIENNISNIFVNVLFITMLSGILLIIKKYNCVKVYKK